MQQQIAPLDCLAHLAGPPAKANRGAAALFGGQLLAYAAASAVVVVDVSCWAVGCKTVPSRLCAGCTVSVLTQQHGACSHPSACMLQHPCAALRDPPRSSPTASRPWLQVQRMAAATTLAGAHRQAAVSVLAWWVATEVALCIVGVACVACVLSGRDAGASNASAGSLLPYSAPSAENPASSASCCRSPLQRLCPARCCRHPGGGPREPRAAAQLRLASGDEEGRVMVWNVNTGAVIAALEDPWASAFGTATGARRPEGGGGPAPGRPPVVGLAWATASSSVLAVLLAPCVLLLWDYRSERVGDRGERVLSLRGACLRCRPCPVWHSMVTLTARPPAMQRAALCGARTSARLRRLPACRCAVAPVGLQPLLQLCSLLGREGREGGREWGTSEAMACCSDFFCQGLLRACNSPALTAVIFPFQVDPLDRRRLVLCGSKGSFIVLRWAVRPTCVAYDWRSSAYGTAVLCHCRAPTGACAPLLAVQPDQPGGRQGQAPAVPGEAAVLQPVPLLRVWAGWCDPALDNALGTWLGHHQPLPLPHSLCRWTLARAARCAAPSVRPRTCCSCCCSARCGGRAVAVAYLLLH